MAHLFFRCKTQLTALMRSYWPQLFYLYISRLFPYTIFVLQQCYKVYFIPQLFIPYDLRKTKDPFLKVVVFFLTSSKFLSSGVLNVHCYLWSCFDILLSSRWSMSEGFPSVRSLSSIFVICQTRTYSEVHSCPLSLTLSPCAQVSASQDHMYKLVFGLSHRISLHGSLQKL